MPSETTAASPVPSSPALPVLVVHAALRRELRLAGPLVRQLADAGPDRIEVVADHLELVLRQLQHHHELEDDVVWPRLLARAGAAVLPVVEVMQVQHAAIEALLGSCRNLLAALRAGAGADIGDLADLLEQLHHRLEEHLELEERVVLPLAEEHLDASEWQLIGRRADASTPRRERALWFGMLQHEGDPEVLASMLRSAPRLARVLVPRLGRRAHRRHAIAVHGTPTP